MHLKTRREPTMTPEEFQYFMLHYPKVDTKAKYQEFEQSARLDFPEHGKFTMRWLAKTLKKIDEIYYENQLLPYISKLYGTLRISPMVDERVTAAFVVENDSDGLDLCLNQQLFIDLFNTPKRSYHAGGLVCSSIFDCLSHVLLHECIHLALTVCEKLGLFDDSKHHGATFMKIAKRMLSQCDSLHGLVPGLIHEESLCSIRKNLYKGQPVFVFFKCRFVPAIVANFGRTKVEVEIDGTLYVVHIGLVKPRT